MKVVTVVGARPQFVKAAVVSRVLRKRHTEVLVHTGQHYDYNMSEHIFEELALPHPDCNLGISGGSHGAMTGRMLMALDELLQHEAPDAVLVYGDTNSTLAAALAAAKLHIPLCHVEAGTRTYDLHNPEEINRVCTDHVASLLLTSTQLNFENLKLEHLADKGLFVGDTMYDAFRYYSARAALPAQLMGLDAKEHPVPERFYYLTCHREENTADAHALTEILRAMEQLDAPVLYPVHPRNKERAQQICAAQHFSNTLLAEPVGYLESLALLQHAQKVVTDSGGLQREAFFAGVQCVTVLDLNMWPETLVGNRNQLAKAQADNILCKLQAVQTVEKGYQPFGDGNAAEKIVAAMEKLNTQAP